jgi:hypothetical protein
MNHHVDSGESISDILCKLRQALEDPEVVRSLEPQVHANLVTLCQEATEQIEKAQSEQVKKDVIRFVSHRLFSEIAEYMLSILNLDS